MRTSEERKALHTTPQKPIVDNTDNLRDNSTRYFTAGGEAYREDKVSGVSWFSSLTARLNSIRNDRT